MGLSCHFYFIYLRSVKAWAYIFSFYMLALVVGPSLSSVHEFASIVGETIGLDLTSDGCDHDAEHQRDCGDTPCSPLCDCYCCVHIIDIPRSTFIVLSAPTVQPTSVDTEYTGLMSLLGVGGIWQPPRQA